MKSLTLTRPDDFHLHLRDQPFLEVTVPPTAKHFARALVMPNLQPPITTLEKLGYYKKRILAAAEGYDFTPLMTLYLTEQSDPMEIKRGFAEGLVTAVKIYPQGATTHSEAGVRDLKKTDAVFQVMEQIGMPLSIHGEVVDPAIDIFDREKVFLERVLAPLRADFPALKIILEHITTKEAVDFVTEAQGPIAASITAHHLHLDRNDLLAGGIRPHFYCLPIVKRAEHKEALIEAATSGNPKFFLGTDSAPHAQAAKETACGCAGVYSAPVALGAYLEVFEQRGALDRFEAFASFYGADFYGLPRNPGKITMVKEDLEVPEFFVYGCEVVMPFRSEAKVAWKPKGDQLFKEEDWEEE